ncbi:MAG: hypothetical protein ACRDDZ_06360 [Marinifilaceae bacterium]
MDRVIGIKIINVNLQQAKDIDWILQQAQTTRTVDAGDIFISKPHFSTLGKIMEQYDFGKFLGGTLFIVYPQGYVFGQEYSLTSMYNEHVKREQEEYDFKIKERAHKRKERMYQVIALILTAISIIAVNV